MEKKPTEKGGVPNEQVSARRTRTRKRTKGSSTGTGTGTSTSTSTTSCRRRRRRRRTSRSKGPQQEHHHQEQHQQCHRRTAAAAPPRTRNWPATEAPIMQTMPMHTFSLITSAKTAHRKPACKAGDGVSTGSARGQHRVSTGSRPAKPARVGGQRVGWRQQRRGCTASSRQRPQERPQQRCGRFSSVRWRCGRGCVCVQGVGAGAGDHARTRARAHTHAALWSGPATTTPPSLRTRCMGARACLRVVLASTANPTNSRWALASMFEKRDSPSAKGASTEPCMCLAMPVLVPSSRPTATSLVHSRHTSYAPSSTRPAHRQRTVSTRPAHRQRTVSTRPAHCRHTSHAPTMPARPSKPADVCTIYAEARPSPPARC